MGFTLLEVLVSVIILTLGILGAVSLQTVAFQNNREARLQATATKFAAEIADAMRANKSVGQNTTASANPYLVDYSYSPSTAPTFPSITEECDTENCTSALNVAKWEIRSILERIHSELPYARTRVCVDDNPYDTSGKARWSCTGTGDFISIKLGWGARDFSTGKVETSQSDTVLPKIVFLSRAGS
jgi:type IV pilus assembly protein PilV